MNKARTTALEIFAAILIGLVLTATSASADAPMPTIGIIGANDIAQTTATFYANVTPNGSSTTVCFEYGTTTAYGLTSCVQMPETDSASHLVSAPITGLQEGTTYHLQVQATNSSGNTSTGDLAFQTGTRFPLVTDPASVEFSVYASGGAIIPLEKNGSEYSIANTGSVTISNAVTGAVVFSQELTFDFTGDAAPQNTWTFNSLNLPPGNYRYCGSIAAGNSYAGWSSCQSYVTGPFFGHLWSFQKGYNSKRRLVVPLHVDPALSGQPIKVAVTRYRFVTGGFTGWQRTSNTSSYQTTVRPGQTITAGPALRRNQQAKIVVSFSNLREIPSEVGGNPALVGKVGKQNSSCTDYLHGAVSSRLIPSGMSKKKLSKPDFVGKRSYCS